MTDEAIKQTDETQVNNPVVMEKILATFRTDKLCPGCGGPMELGRTVSCLLCDIKRHVRTQLDFIEGGVMGIGYELGIRKPPPARREVSPSSPTKKPARKTTKKPARKAATKKTRKTTKKRGNK